MKIPMLAELVACAESDGTYRAVTLDTPVVERRIIAEHDPLANVQVPLGVKFTVPRGLEAEPDPVSTTVALHESGMLMVPVVGQYTIV
jgi:hypothetical protein